MMSVFVGALPPNIVKWFWWRANGWSLVAGCLGGLLAALCVSLLPDFGGYSEIVSFLIVLLVSAVATVSATLLTPPAPMETLVAFYSRTRPAGAWEPVRSRLPEELARSIRAENRHDLSLLPVAVLWHFSLFSIWGCVIFKQWNLVAGLTITVLVTSGILYTCWYRKLKKD